LEDEDVAGGSSGKIEHYVSTALVHEKAKQSFEKGEGRGLCTHQMYNIQIITLKMLIWKLSTNLMLPVPINMPLAMKNQFFVGPEPI